MNRYRRLFLLLLALIPLRLLAGDLEVKIGSADAVKFSEADLAALPQESMKAKEHDGTEATWSGASFTALLEKAGVKFGDALRGPALANYVLVTAADGYRAVIALPELDPANGETKALLANKREGVALDARHGPLRLLFPRDKHHYRWVRQVVKIEVLEAPGLKK